MKINLELHIDLPHEIDIPIGEIVEQINQLKPISRWNLIAKIINNEINSEVEPLSDQYKNLVAKWLKSKYKEFKEFDFDRDTYKLKTKNNENNSPNREGANS